MSAKYFLTVKNDDGLEKTVVISDSLQAIIDYVHQCRYIPAIGYCIYVCHETPLLINYVDGKILIQ